MQSIMLAIQASMMAQYNSTILHNPYTECRYCTALHQHALLHIHTKQRYCGDISRMKIDSLTNVMKRKLGLMKRSIIQNSKTFRYFSNQRSEEKCFNVAGIFQHTKGPTHYPINFMRISPTFLVLTMARAHIQEAFMLG